MVVGTLSGIAFVIGLFCVPFLPAVVLTVTLLRSQGARGALWSALVGVGIALCFIGFAATKGWLGTGPAACGGDGCWIDSMRSATEAAVGVSFGLWLLGVGVGAAIHGFSARRGRRSVDA